jgi:hypothetical protein
VIRQLERAAIFQQAARPVEQKAVARWHSRAVAPHQQHWDVVEAIIIIPDHEAPIEEYIVDRCHTFEQRTVDRVERIEAGRAIAARCRRERGRGRAGRIDLLNGRLRRGRERGRGCATWDIGGRRRERRAARQQDDQREHNE